MKTKSVPLPKLLKKTEKIVNAFIRKRDQDLGCISDGCDGGVDHAGHYFNVGQHSALRFEETNIHGCCLRCNVFLHGNLIKYRQGLLKRYGTEYVDRLESMERDQPKVKKWDRTELNEIIQKYKL